MLLALVMAPLWGASYYTVRLDDPKAVYLTRENFPVRGDGIADDTTPSSRRSTRCRRPPARASSSFRKAGTG